jgi:hypothetical protein
VNPPGRAAEPNADNFFLDSAMMDLLVVGGLLASVAGDELAVAASRHLRADEAGAGDVVSAATGLALVDAGGDEPALQAVGEVDGDRDDGGLEAQQPSDQRSGWQRVQLVYPAFGIVEADDRV